MKKAWFTGEKAVNLFLFLTSVFYLSYTLTHYKIGTARMPKEGFMPVLLGVGAVLHYLIAVPIAFLAGIAVNYLIGVWFVFRRGNLSRGKELLLFLTISLLALAVTEGSMYLFTDLFQIDYRISRLISGVITYLFNFFSRRFLIYRSESQRISQASLE